MEKNIKFHGYSITEFNLNKNKNNKRKKIETEINSTIYNNNDKKDFYKVIFEINTTSEKEMIKMTLEGLFEFPKDSTQEEIDKFLNYSAPSILYPYCRSFISMVTSYDGEDALMLPIYNFYE